MITLSIVTLTKSCLRAVDCTYDEARGVSTLDAMPDVECDTMSAVDPMFFLQAFSAVLLMVLYLLAIPGLIGGSLYRAKNADRLGERKFRQRYGWFLLKYRAVGPSQHRGIRMRSETCVLSRERGTPSLCSSTTGSR